MFHGSIVIRKLTMPRIRSISAMNGLFAISSDRLTSWLMGVILSIVVSMLMGSLSCVLIRVTAEVGKIPMAII